MIHIADPKTKKVSSQWADLPDEGKNWLVEQVLFNTDGKDYLHDSELAIAILKQKHPYAEIADFGDGICEIFIGARGIHIGSDQNLAERIYYLLLKEQGVVR